jgi:SAM-dependent methyltransferase
MTNEAHAGWTPSARRASTLYDEKYADQYRAHDDALPSSQPSQELAAWLHGICLQFTDRIDVLDLGCGTGRYFWSLTRVRRLVGVDASAAMLARARHPYQATSIAAESVTLIEGDLMTQTFPSASFDLVYSIGVLAEHAPLTREILQSVHAWLRPGGRFALTAVHPESPSIPQTLKRRLASLAAPVVRGAAGRTLRTRLLSHGMYADESFILQAAESLFDVEKMDRFTSEAHLHVRAVLRKSAA